MQFPDSLAAVFARAEKIVVLTGAGVSAESGVPTFRESMTGMWSKIRMEDVATPGAFRRDPGLVWRWWESWRRDVAVKACPNPGHFALAEMARRVPQFTLITQNVDGLHQRAGSTGVLELHGSIGRVKCYDDQEPVESWTDSGDQAPRCPRCGGFLRHDIVWFEESLPEHALMQAYERSATCDLFLSVGTSTVVYPAAELPFHALRHGATVVEINPDRTPLTDSAHFVLNGPSGSILPELAKLLPQAG